MGKRQAQKEIRRKAVLDLVREDPFMTDEDLAETLNVSVPTVRLDRAELSIPELRERIRLLAAQTRGKVRSLAGGEIVGEIVELELNSGGVSILETDDGMVFEKTQVVRGHFIYALAESLAIAVITEDAALVGFANIKYAVPVFAGSRLIARCELRDIKVIGEKRFFVWVKIYVKKTEVFRGKFILVALGDGLAEDFAVVGGGAELLGSG
ncbi:MAG: transcription factor FapR [Clostridiales bacterium]|nr:transcription factor FapR [Clostridiales bacterium]